MNKVAGYKINTQKSLAFLYAKNEKKEREIKETIPFTIATKRIKHLGVCLQKTKTSGLGFRSGGRGIPCGVSRSLDQGDWDPGSVSWEAACNDRMLLHADAPSSPERPAQAQGGDARALQSWKLMLPMLPLANAVQVT